MSDTLPTGNTDPRPVAMVRLTDLQNPLQEIAEDIAICQDLIEADSRNNTVTTHMRAVMTLSSLEIKMTNFAQAMRERFK